MIDVRSLGSGSEEIDRRLPASLPPCAVVDGAPRRPRLPSLRLWPVGEAGEREGDAAEGFRRKYCFILGSKRGLCLTRGLQNLGLTAAFHAFPSAADGPAEPSRGTTAIPGQRYEWRRLAAEATVAAQRSIFSEGTLRRFLASEPVCDAPVTGFGTRLRPAVPPVSPPMMFTR